MTTFGDFCRRLGIAVEAWQEEMAMKGVRVRRVGKYGTAVRRTVTVSQDVLLSPTVPKMCPSRTSQEPR